MSAEGKCQAVADKKPAPSQRVAAGVPARALRILLAEDNRAIQKLVRHILEERGHTVVAAETGLQAVHLVCAGQFDVVLMDIQMPVMDGLEAVAEIRKLFPALPPQAVIALTLDGEGPDRQRCLAAGMDDYLCKPVVRRELIEAVERLGARGCRSCLEMPESWRT